MTDPYIGEIRAVGFNFAPYQWAFCDGQMLPISSFTALYSLLGTTYGGDGRTTFALPNMMDRSPMGQGRGPGLTDTIMGERQGVATITLNESQLPSHSHQVSVTAETGDTDNPTGAYTAQAISRGRPSPTYRQTFDNPVSMGPNTLHAVGGNEAHENVQPYLCIPYVISLEGIYPTRP